MSGCTLSIFFLPSLPSSGAWVEESSLRNDDFDQDRSSAADDRTSLCILTKTNHLLGR